jgi:hypothetical protein
MVRDSEFDGVPQFRSEINVVAPDGTDEVCHRVWPWVRVYEPREDISMKREDMSTVVITYPFFSSTSFADTVGMAHARPTIINTANQ